LVEGDSDYIAFPHIAETLNTAWNCRSCSVTFVRVGGKGSLARYRSFFARFDVPVFVITDLDTVDDDFDKLDPTDEAKALRADLIQKADAANAAAGVAPVVNAAAIKKAQAKPELLALWENVCAARTLFDADKSKMPELEAAVSAFFAWEKKSIRRDCIRKAEQADVKEAKVALIWELRKKGVFVLENGALDDYYPEAVTGADKPSLAQSFRKLYTTREQLLALSPTQTCPTTNKVCTEFEHISSAIFT